MPVEIRKPILLLLRRIGITRLRLQQILERPARHVLRGLRRFITVENKADEICRGDGLEVGPLSRPYKFTRAQMRYADIVSSRDMRKILNSVPIDRLYEETLVEPDIILRPPRFDLPSIPDRHFDFVYSSHSLEHSPNPIFSLSEYMRVVKNLGYVYTVIPNKDETYDVKRATTPVSVLLTKYRNDVFFYTLEEALDVVENTVGHPLYAGKGRDFAEQILREDTGIHHFHTFDVKSVVDIVVFCKSEFNCQLSYFCAEGNSIHFCLQRL